MMAASAMAARVAASPVGHGLVLVVAGLVLLLVLAMPKRDRVNGCIDRVELGLGLTYAHNCDSRHITRDARNLGRYLAEASPSRTRPVHVLAVAAVTHVLSPVLVPLAATLGPLKPLAGELLPFYLGAIVVNAGVVALSWMVLVRLVGAGSDALTRAALMGLVVSYDVTVAWFWVPHQILMNLLAPLGGVLAFVTGMRAAHLSVSARAWLGLATAAACLTYGYCLIWPIAFALGIGYAAWTEDRLDPRRMAVVLLPYGAAVVVPLLLWLGAFALAGREVAYEAQSYGQFTWLGTAWKQGTVVRDASARVAELGAFLGGSLGAWGWLSIAAAVGLVGVVSRLLPARRVLTDPVVLGGLVTLGLMLVFNYLQGYHQARLLMFPLLLAQVVILRLLAIASVPRGVAIAATLITLVQVAGGFLGPPTSMD